MENTQQSKIYIYALIAIIIIALIIAIFFSLNSKDNQNDGENTLTAEEKEAIEETFQKTVREIPEREKDIIEKAFSVEATSTSAARGSVQNDGLSAEERAKIEQNLSR